MPGIEVLVVLLAALPTATVADEVQKASERHGLPPRLVMAVAQVESSLNPRAVSPMGARGLMQLMPATAKRFNVSDPMDLGDSLEGGCRYLAWLRQEFEGNLILMLAAYNAGESAVRRYDGVPPYDETRSYVIKVLREMKILREKRRE